MRTTKINTASPHPAIFNQCQRWREHRSSYRPAGEPVRPELYGVERIEERHAKAFVTRHHYSGSFPAARISVGLFRAQPLQAATLVGVAVFGVPMTQRAIPKYLGVEARAGVELSRFVLLDEEPANAETFFLARAFAVLRNTLNDVQAVLSYSDPQPRTDACGNVLMPGHVGTIYRAHNAHWFGRSRGRTLVIDRNGRVVSERSLSKIRNDERGAAGAYRRLLELGAPRLRPGEAPRDYTRRALEEGPFRRLRHPGNLVYGWALGSARLKRRLSDSFAPSYPYSAVA